MTAWKALTRPPNSDRPSRRWLPANLHVWGMYPRQREVSVRNARAGDRERRLRKRYDVLFDVDGHQFRYGFDQEGWADDFVVRLRRGFAQELFLHHES